MKLEDLNTERKEKFASCQSAEEMLKLAELEGIELDDEQLEAISGGDSWDSGHLGRPCPYCGKHVDYESGTRMPKYCPVSLWQQAEGRCGSNSLNRLHMIWV